MCDYIIYGAFHQLTNCNLSRNNGSSIDGRISARITLLHVNQSALVKRIKLTLAHFMAQCLYARWCIKGLICRFRPERTSMELWFYLSSAYQGVSELRQKTIFYMKTTCGEGGGWAQTPAGGGLEHVDFVYLFK